LKARVPFLDINQERHHAYAGYEGMIEMAKELEEALYSPIWEQLRTPAPWETGKGEPGDSEQSPVNSDQLTVTSDQLTVTSEY
jgi:nitrogenase molybdenum-cofactor synthesis protein NifE